MEISLVNKTNIKVKGKNAGIFLESLDGPSKINEFVLPGVGEYEVAGITGIIINLPPTLFHFVVDDVNLCFVGTIDHKLSNTEIEFVGDVDILVIDSNSVSDVVSQLSARCVIPVGNNEKFLKDLGVENAAPVLKLLMTKDKLPETTTVYALG